MRPESGATTAQRMLRPWSWGAFPLCRCGLLRLTPARYHGPGAMHRPVMVITWEQWGPWPALGRCARGRHNATGRHNAQHHATHPGRTAVSRGADRPHGARPPGERRHGARPRGERRRRTVDPGPASLGSRVCEVSSRGASGTLSGHACPLPGAVMACGLALCGGAGVLGRASGWCPSRCGAGSNCCVASAGWCGSPGAGGCVCRVLDARRDAVRPGAARISGGAHW